jgi:hypothetical protein
VPIISVSSTLLPVWPHASVETLVQNAYDWFPDSRREIDKDEIDKRSVASLIFTRPVKTLTLTPLLATQLSLPKDVHGGKRQRDSQRFSTALYRQSDIEVIAYRSTWVGFECLAVYDRALDALAVAAEVPLNQHPGLGDALLSLNMRVKYHPSPAARSKPQN